ncbi:MAG: Holliday junction resolvase-like protein [Anaerolineae bacterium]
MDILLLIVGVLIGATVVFFWMQSRQEARLEALRAELIEAYEARAKATQAHLIQEYEAKIQELKATQSERIKEARQDSADRSRAVLKGRMAEQVAPLLPGFDYWPADARFLGSPIDYMIFDGYSRVRDKITNGDAMEVVLLDIKRGKARLSHAQRQIARAVEEGRVRFEIVRIFDDGEVKKHTWRLRKNKSEK